MRMQEPEQWQSSEAAGQEWQSNQDFSGYQAETGRYEQQQKIYPQEARESREARVSVIAIFLLILSAVGFGPSIVGIVGSAIVLNYANGNQSLLITGGILGLVGSIISLLLFITIFILSVISVARRAIRYRRRRFPS